MKCGRCGYDVAWPNSITPSQRHEILSVAHESRVKAQVMLVQKLGLSMLDAKGIVMHLVGENNGCCRHRCGGQIVGDVKSRVASCAKCGAANLGV